MELQTTIYLVVGLSFALYIGIAFWARAGSTSEFYAAGGQVGPKLNGMATAADWMSAASFISMAGLIANMGYGGALFLMGWTGGYVLLAMLLAPYLRKFGKFTVPQFIGDRFYSKAASTVAVVCLLTASTTYIIGQMTGVGVAFSRFLNVSSDTGIYIGQAIVFLYAVFGGMKGITYTQVAQYIVLIFAYTIPAIFISLQLTGNPIPQLGLGGDFVGTDMSLLAKLDQVVTDLGFGQYTTTTAGSTLNMFVYTLSLMIGTAGLPHVIMRFFTVPSVKDARSSAGWALIFIAILYTTAPAVAAMAKLNLHGTVNTAVKAGGDLYAPEASIKAEDRPDWMKRWEKTGLLKFEDKNGDGRIQYYNDKTKDEAAKAKAEAAGWTGDGQPRNRAVAQLGDCAGGGGRLGGSAVHGGGLADGHFFGGVARSGQGRVRARHQRERRADGRQDRHGGGHCDFWLPGSEPTRVRGGHRGPGLRHRRLLVVPGHHDGHFLQEDEQRRGHGGHVGGAVRDLVLRVRAQGHLLRERHRLPAPHRWRQQLLWHHARGVWCGGCPGQLCGGRGGVQNDVPGSSPH